MNAQTAPAALSNDTTIERGFIASNGDFLSSYPESGDITGAGLRIGTNLIALTFGELTTTMRDYLAAMGIRHLLGDATASAKKIRDEGDDRTIGEIALELATDKAESLRKGEVSRRGAGGSGLNIVLNGSDGKAVTLLSARWVKAIAEVISAAGEAKTPAEIATLLRGTFVLQTEKEAKASAAAWRANTAVRTVYDRLTQEAKEKSQPRTSGDANTALQMFATLGLGAAPAAEGGDGT